MSYMVMRVFDSGGVWVEGHHATEQRAELAAEKGNAQAERFGLPWVLEVVGVVS